MKRLLCFFVLVLTFSFAQAKEHAGWLSKAVFYQIYPSSFQDSDGNGIGDLKGIESRLDYIKSIGVNTVWLNPIFKSAFKDGGYDVIDYYLVDPRFGTNTQLIELAEQVHRRGMHIILDLVAGHTSDQSPWFKQSMEGDRNLQYSDYFIWPSFKPDNMPREDGSRFVESKAPRAKYYIKNFFDSQPALNYGYAHPNPNNPWEQSVDAPGPQAVRQELKDIIAFWMNKGVDGFRVDMAFSLVKGDDQNRSATIALWKEMTAWYRDKFPQGALVAEWFDPKQSIEGGFDIDFIRPGELLYSAGRRQATPTGIYFSKEGIGNPTAWMQIFKGQYAGVVDKGYISVPTGNHDLQRMANAERNSVAELNVIMTFMLTQAGIPFIYYGDEIGMKNIPGLPGVEGSMGRSSSRTPMQWDDSTNAGFSTATADKLYIPLDTDPNRPTVAKQQGDQNSVLNYVRELLKLRASSLALGNNGKWELLSDLNQPYPMVYMRTDGNEKYIVALNPSDKKVEAKISALGANRVNYVFGTTEKCSYKSDKSLDIIKLPPVSAAIFEIAK
jgi:maltose alpha-D-glucosyltransferase / alpha-amylase